VLEYLGSPLHPRATRDMSYPISCPNSPSRKRSTGQHCENNTIIFIPKFGHHICRVHDCRASRLCTPVVSEHSHSNQTPFSSSSTPLPSPIVHSIKQRALHWLYIQYVLRRLSVMSGPADLPRLKQKSNIILQAKPVVLCFCH